MKSACDIIALLFFCSFGQAAVFLLGGQSIDDEPTAMYIRSGDVVIMSGYSRLCYHGIPKIMKSTSAPWEPDTVLRDDLKRDFNSSHADSQTAETKTDSTANSAHEVSQNQSPEPKKRKLDTTSLIDKVECFKIEHLCDDKFWSPFKKYVEHSRINMNVRQVLHAGQNALKSNATPHIETS